MSAKKKKIVKKESTPGIVQSSFHTPREIELAIKKLDKLKELEMEIVPEIANAAKHPGRPYKCLSPKTLRYHLEMQEIYYTSLLTCNLTTTSATGVGITDIA